MPVEPLRSTPGYSPGRREEESSRLAISLYTSYSFCHVVRPTTPSAVSPKYRWNRRTAAVVPAPNFPSTVTFSRLGYTVRAIFSQNCTSRTFCPEEPSRSGVPG